MNDPENELDPQTAARLLAEEMERRLSGTPLSDEEIRQRFPGREAAVRELLNPPA